MLGRETMQINAKRQRKVIALDQGGCAFSLLVGSIGGREGDMNEQVAITSSLCAKVCNSHPLAKVYYNNLAFKRHNSFQTRDESKESPRYTAISMDTIMFLESIVPFSSYTLFNTTWAAFVETDLGKEHNLSHITVARKPRLTVKHFW
jgi:hypothetical protein